MIRDVPPRARVPIALAAAILLSAAGSAAAQYPEGPVTIVVPFSAGSGTDTGTRVLAEALRPLLDQPIVVDNRPGANGAIAAGLVATAEADGYTLLMGSNSTQSANPLMIRSLSYDPATDFVSIGMIGTFDGLLAVNHGRLPFETTEELVAHIRANPGTISYSTGSVTSLVNGAMFARGLGVEMLQVPYRSSPEALTAVVSGEVDLMLPDIAASQSFVQTGALKALGSITADGEPASLAPDLIPLSQSISPDLAVVGWIGLFAPADTPDDVVARLSQAVEEVVSSQAFTERLATLGANARFMGADELDAHIAAERASFAETFDAIGLEPQ